MARYQNRRSRPVLSFEVFAKRRGPKMFTRSCMPPSRSGRLRAWSMTISDHLQTIRSNSWDNCKGWSLGGAGAHLNAAAIRLFRRFSAASTIAWLLLLPWTLRHDSPQGLRDHMATFYQIRGMRLTGLVVNTMVHQRRLSLAMILPCPSQCNMIKVQLF